MCYMRVTSSVTLADLLEASMAAKLVASTCLQPGIGGAQNRRTLYQMSYTGSAKPANVYGRNIFNEKLS